jgi:hypothetical protein
MIYCSTYKFKMIEIFKNNNLNDLYLLALMWTMADHPIVTYWMRRVLHRVLFYRICPQEENHFSIDLIANSRSHPNLLQDIHPLEVESRESHLQFYSINSRQNCFIWLKRAFAVRISSFGVTHILCSIKIKVCWTPTPYVTLFCNVNLMVVTLGSWPPPTSKLCYVIYGWCLWHFMKHISECNALCILALNLKFDLKIKSIFLSFKSFYVLYQVSKEKIVFANTSMICVIANRKNLRKKIRNSRNFCWLKVSKDLFSYGK